MLFCVLLSCVFYQKVDLLVEANFVLHWYRCVLMWQDDVRKVMDIGVECHRRKVRQVEDE